MSDTSTTEATAAHAPAPTRARGQLSGKLNVTAWVLQVLGAALFIYAGLAKLSGDPMQVEGFQAMGLGIAGMYIIGVLEIAGGVGLLLPGVSGFAATCLVGLMVGATIVTIGLMGLVPLIAAPVVTLILVAVIAWLRRRNTVAFLRFVFGR
jgi:uncharacterized membrane protein